MGKKENPGAGAAHGASDSILAGTPDNNVNGENRQPASRYDLIRYHSLMCLFDGDDCIDTYDTVPDRARTDKAIGTVEMREDLFLALASIVESTNGGWPFDIKQSVTHHYSRLIARFGDGINADLVELLFLETLKNEGVFFDQVKPGGGNSNGSA